MSFKGQCEADELRWMRGKKIQLPSICLWFFVLIICVAKYVRNIRKST